VCSVWAWTDPHCADAPLCSVALPAASVHDRQHGVKFNPADPADLLANGSKSAFFLTWFLKSGGGAVLEAYAPQLNRYHTCRPANTQEGP